MKEGYLSNYIVPSLVEELEGKGEEK